MGLYLYQGVNWVGLSCYSWGGGEFGLQTTRLFDGKIINFAVYFLS